MLKYLQLAVLCLYVTYLVHVGLMMIVVPWSSVWPHLLTFMPLRLAYALDQPAIRGAISAFGALHILLVALEMLSPSVRKRLLG